MWEAAEIGRLLYTHGLDPALVAGALGVNGGDATCLASGAAIDCMVAADRRYHAALLLNVLIRVELRCGHDTIAIRAALGRPLDALGGDSIAERLLADPDIAGLRLLREAAGTMPVPKVKMWRVPDTYS